VDPQEINRRISALFEEIRELQGECEGWARHPDATDKTSIVYQRLASARAKIGVLSSEHARLRPA
jgi:hypothetical protein